jgi:hypothetical protein
VKHEGTLSRWLLLCKQVSKYPIMDHFRETFLFFATLSRNGNEHEKEQARSARHLSAVRKSATKYCKHVSRAIDVLLRTVVTNN